MKNSIVYILMTCLFVSSSLAQVGVNTLSPQGALHVDAGVSGSINDDVIVTTTGRLGIGANAGLPSITLDVGDRLSAVVNPVFSLRDGTQHNGKMLVSDAAGLATWSYGGMQVVRGVLPTRGLMGRVTDYPKIAEVSPITNRHDGNLYKIENPQDNTTAMITLPPGTWCVFVNVFIVTLNGNDATRSRYTWMRLSFSDEAGGKVSSDITTSTYLISGAVYESLYDSIQGFMLIRNSGTNDKTYHLGVVYADALPSGTPATLSFNNFGGRDNLENQILAVKVGNN